MLPLIVAPLYVDNTHSSVVLMYAVEHLYDAFGDSPYIYPYVEYDVGLYYNETSETISDFIDLGSLIECQGDDYQSFFNSYQDVIDRYTDMNTNDMSYLGSIKKSMIYVSEAAKNDPNKDFSAMATSAYNNLYNKYFDSLLKYEVDISMPPLLAVNQNLLSSDPPNLDANFTIADTIYLLPFNSLVSIEALAKRGPIQNSVNVLLARRISSTPSLLARVGPKTRSAITKGVPDITSEPTSVLTAATRFIVAPLIKAFVLSNTGVDMDAQGIASFLESNPVVSGATRTYTSWSDKATALLHGENILYNDPYMVDYNVAFLSQDNAELKMSNEIIAIYNKVSGSDLQSMKLSDLSQNTGAYDYIGDPNFGQLVASYFSDDSTATSQNSKDTISEELARNLKLARRFSIIKPSAAIGIPEKTLGDIKTNNAKILDTCRGFTQDGSIDKEVDDFAIDIGIGDSSYTTNHEAVQAISERVLSGTLSAKKYKVGSLHLLNLMSHMEVKYSDESKPLTEMDLNLIETLQSLNIKSPAVRNLQQRLLRRQILKRGSSGKYGERATRVTGKRNF